MHWQTMDRLWYEINIPFFLKKNKHEYNQTKFLSVHIFFIVWTIIMQSLNIKE